MLRHATRRLASDASGGAAMEFAFVAPVLIVLIVGALQISALLYARATVRSALGDGARMATLYRAPTGGAAWAGPTAAEICTRVTSRLRSMANANLTGLSLASATNGTANALVLAATYNVNLNFIVFTRSSALTAGRRVYVKTQPNFGDPAHACTI